MKKLCLLAGIVCSVAMLAPMASSGDQVFSRNVVGYHNITLDPGLNLVALPFQKIPVDVGVISGNTEDTITVADAAWADNFGLNEEGVSTFYIEIASDPNELGIEGLHFYIADVVGGETLNIVDGGLVPDAFAGASYKIVSANRIRDLFGEPGSPLLTGGFGVGDADTILTWTGARWSAPIYYQLEDEWDPNPALDNQWVQAAVAVNDMVIDRDEALFVRSRDDAEKTVTMVGEVSANSQGIVLQSGLNLVGGLSVVEDPIKDSNMLDALEAGFGVGDADTILAWTGARWSAPIYYQLEDEWDPDPELDNQWVQSSVSVHETFSFSPTEGYFIRVRDAEPKGIWVRESPLAK